MVPLRSNAVSSKHVLCLTYFTRTLLRKECFQLCSIQFQNYVQLESSLWFNHMRIFTMHFYRQCWAPRSNLCFYRQCWYAFHSRVFKICNRWNSNSRGTILKFDSISEMRIPHFLTKGRFFFLSIDRLTTPVANKTGTVIFRVGNSIHPSFMVQNFCSCNYFDVIHYVNVRSVIIIIIAYLCFNSPQNMRQ